MPSVRSMVVAGTVVAALLLSSAYLIMCSSSGQAKPEILARCREMQQATYSLDRNAALPFVAPQLRASFGDRNLSLLNAALTQIGPRSSVLVIGDEAVVWPAVRGFHHLILPLGHSVDMVKVKGKWYFT